MEAKFRILVVDDEAELCANMRDVLEANGYSVEIALNGKDAITLYQKTNYDVALVDVKLGDMPGPEVIKKITKISPSTSFIYMTGYASLDTAIGAVEDNNVISYETKPVDMGHLLSVIRQVGKRKHAEEALRKSEEKLAGIVESVSDAMIMMDKQFNIVWTNEVAKNIFGPDLVGKKCYSACLGRDKFCDPCVVKKCFEDSKVHEFETEALRPDEQERAFWCTASVAARHKDGRPRAVVEFLRDITERRQAEEKIKGYSEKLEYMVEEQTRELHQALHDTEQALGKIDGILKSVGDGLIVTDMYNRVVLMNPAAEDLMAVRFSEVIDRPIDFAIQDETVRERIKTTLDKKKGGYEFDFELPGEDTRHPRIIHARTSVIENKTGKQTGIVTIMQDVTHEREVDRLRTEFISMAAHELRTPLTTIQGFSELLLIRDDITGEEKEKFLSYINRQSMNIADIINDFFDINRIESSLGFSVCKAPHNIPDIIRDIVSLFEAQSPEHRFEVVLPEESIELMVDKEKIERVLENILNNAVKYSPEGGAICVSAKMISDFGIRISEFQEDEDQIGIHEAQSLADDSALRTPHSAIEISIADTGIGMTPEQVERVFDKFYRADASDTAIPGTGLGMSIVKYLVGAHDGKVWVESELGKGATVTFTIQM